VTPRCSPHPHAGALRHAAAHNTDRLELELKRLRRYKLLVIDEFGYLAFDHDTANLFFQLVAARYEQGSILVTSNMPFGRCGEIFSDDIVTAAMIDRIVHHAKVLNLTRSSYRLRNKAKTQLQAQ
jgi:DNA replication protein DnaC